MEKSYFKTKICIALLFLTIQSCSKSEKEVYTPTLPPITQTGENTFGCYINGQLLVPRDPKGYYPPGPSPKKGMFYFQGGSSIYTPYDKLEISDSESEGTKMFLNFFLYNLYNLGEGNYLIKQGNTRSDIDNIKTINLWISIFQNSIGKIYYSIEDSGTLTITRYDYGSGIISGIFSCRAVNKDDSSDIIEITQGRFDINLNTLKDTEFQ